MADKTLYARIKYLTQSASNWTINDPTLLNGEVGFESDTGKLKIGDGILSWNSLPYSKVSVIDNLNSDSEVEPLSAKQGKNLRGSIEGTILTDIALSGFLTELRTLITQIAYTTDTSNATATLSALDAVISSISGNYKIEKHLTNCSLSNDANVISSGSSYVSTVITDEGYSVNNVQILMGTTDITSTAWSSSTNTIAIESVTGTIDITAVASESYTEQVIYSNYTGTGEKFSTGDIAIDFSKGDYVEATIDASDLSVVDQTNIFGFGKNGNSNIEGSTGECILVYKRKHNSVDKILFRAYDYATSGSTSLRDQWMDHSDFSNIVIRININGVYLNGVKVTGYNSSLISYITGESKFTLGARSSKLSYATYKRISVFHKN